MKDYRTKLKQKDSFVEHCTDQIPLPLGPLKVQLLEQVVRFQFEVHSSSCVVEREQDEATSFISGDSFFQIMKRAITCWGWISNKVLVCLVESVETK